MAKLDWFRQRRCVPGAFGLCLARRRCRNLGIALVLASQEAKDFNVSIFSAIANYLVLRLNEPDAKALVRNVSSSDRERMLVDKIKGMDRFKGIYFSEGEPPSPVSLPLL